MFDCPDGSWVKVRGQTVLERFNCKWQLRVFVTWHWGGLCSRWASDMKTSYLQLLSWCLCQLLLLLVLYSSKQTWQQLGNFSSCPISSLSLSLAFQADTKPGSLLQNDVVYLPFLCLVVLTAPVPYWGWMCTPLPSHPTYLCSFSRAAVVIYLDLKLIVSAGGRTPSPSFINPIWKENGTLREKLRRLTLSPVHLLHLHQSQTLSYMKLSEFSPMFWKRRHLSVMTKFIL